MYSLYFSLCLFIINIKRILLIVWGWNPHTVGFATVLTQHTYPVFPLIFNLLRSYNGSWCVLPQSACSLPSSHFGPLPSPRGVVHTSWLRSVSHRVVRPSPFSFGGFKLSPIIDHDLLDFVLLQTCVWTTLDRCLLCLLSTVFCWHVCRVGRVLTVLSLHMSPLHSVQLTGVKKIFQGLEWGNVKRIGTLTAHCRPRTKPYQSWRMLRLSLNQSVSRLCCLPPHY